MNERKQYWLIHVGGGYGSFLFYGTPAEAEEMRRHKAEWEGAVARKMAIPDNILTEEAKEEARRESATRYL